MNASDAINEDIKIAASNLDWQLITTTSNIGGYKKNKENTKNTKNIIYGL